MVSLRELSNLLAQRNLPPVGQEMITLAGLGLSQFSSQPTENQDNILRLLQWLSTLKSMPLIPKLQDHLFSHHFPFGHENHQSMGPANFLQTWKKSQGFISISTLKSKHNPRPGHSAETRFHNSMCSLLCAQLHPDDVFPCCCAQNVVRQQWPWHGWKG